MKRSAAISGPNLGASIRHPRALDQAMAMAYGPQRDQIIIFVWAAADTTTSAIGLYSHIVVLPCRYGFFVSYLMILKHQIFDVHSLD
jgi:hypothetical protein